MLLKSFNVLTNDDKIKFYQIYSVMSDILLLNGPNLNMLGMRESHYYGTTTLDAIVADLNTLSQQAGLKLQHKQSNSESSLIKYIHKAYTDGVLYIIINPAAFTHTSIALRDALLAVNIPFVEIHLSNIYKREDFRRQSYFADIAQGVISGFGVQGYVLAIEVAIKHIKQLKKDK